MRAIAASNTTMLGIHSIASSTTAPSLPTVPRSSLASALAQAERAAATWRTRALPLRSDDGSSTSPWLLHCPDVGPSCEMLLADRLFHDLTAEEREGLLTFVRRSQDEDGCWKDAQGRPDLSLTALGWWARRQAGDDPQSDSMVRAQRIVHALGGAQRGNFTLRLWLAMAGHVPWSYLPAIPGELFLLPDHVWLSPSRTSPWARGMLTPYYILASAPARLHLSDASPLLLERRPETLVAPRLTRPGLAGDLLQAFDRSVRLARKLPRGAVPRWAGQRAEQRLHAMQQHHGGWFGVQPTLLSLLALRVLGATSNDPRVRRGLDYLRRARGWVLDPQNPAAPPMLAQGLTTPPLAALARLIDAGPQDEAALRWLLAQELTEPGPWQDRADASIGGWPSEAAAGQHLDVLATCEALQALHRIAPASPLAGAAWASTRRALDVIVAMQEGHGGFARFERGEAQVFMQRFPWTDADLLAFGSPGDAEHVRLSAAALAQLGYTGFRTDDDRVERGVRWLQSQSLDAPALNDTQLLASLAETYAATCSREHPALRDVERRLRGRQREDGSFGSLVDTAAAIRGLLAAGELCVQTIRAARNLVDTLAKQPDVLEHATGAEPAAAACATSQALRAFLAAGGTLAS